MFALNEYISVSLIVWAPVLVSLELDVGLRVMSGFCCWFFFARCFLASLNPSLEILYTRNHIYWFFFFFLEGNLGLLDCQLIRGRYYAVRVRNDNGFEKTGEIRPAQSSLYTVKYTNKTMNETGCLSVKEKDRMYGQDKEWRETE